MFAFNYDILFFKIVGFLPGDLFLCYFFDFLFFCYFSDCSFFIWILRFDVLFEFRVFSYFLISFGERTDEDYIEDVQDLSLTLFEVNRVSPVCKFICIFFCFSRFKMGMRDYFSSLNFVSLLFPWFGTSLSNGLNKLWGGILIRSTAADLKLILLCVECFLGSELDALLLIS